MKKKGNKFYFHEVMKTKAQENRFYLDDHQHHIAYRLNELTLSYLNPKKFKMSFEGIYIWGKVKRGKIFSGRYFTLKMSRD